MSAATVILTTAERDAAALQAHGFHATHRGSPELEGARVVVWPPAGRAGDAAASEAVAALNGIAAEIRVLRWPGAVDGWGAADFWSDGGSDTQLDAMLADAPLYETRQTAPDENWPLLRDLLERPELLEPPEEVLCGLAWKGRTTLLSGADKLGKSTYASHGATAITRGGWWQGQRVKQGRAILCAPDEALGDSVRRLHELGADADRLRILHVRPPDLLGSLRALLEQWPADLVVVDSLAEWARIVRGSAPEDGDAAGWGLVVRPLVQLTRDFPGAALLLLHHPRRSDGQYRGSGEIAAAVDCLLEMTPPQSGEDATVRRIRGRARWPIQPYSVALRGDRYELVGGMELSADVRVLMHVEHHAATGTSLRATREAVSGARGRVDAAVNALLGRGAIERRSDGRLYPALAQQAGMEGV